MIFKLKWNNKDKNKFQMINFTAHLSHVVNLYPPFSSGNKIYKCSERQTEREILPPN